MKYSNSMIEPKIGDVVEWEQQINCHDQYGTWNCGSSKRRGRIVALHPENKKSFEVEYDSNRTIRIAKCNLVHQSKSSENVVRSMLRDLSIVNTWNFVKGFLSLKGTWISRISSQIYKHRKKENKMKTNINWINLIQNTIRCIFAYPVVFALIVISIPLNIFIWCGWLIELTTSFFNFIFKGDSEIDDTFFYEVFFSYKETFIFKILSVFALTLIGIEYLTESFNKTLKPIMKEK